MSHCSISMSSLFTLVSGFPSRHLGLPPCTIQLFFSSYRHSWFPPLVNKSINQWIYRLWYHPTGLDTKYIILYTVLQDNITSAVSDKTFCVTTLEIVFYRTLYILYICRYLIMTSEEQDWSLGLVGRDIPAQSTPVSRPDILNRWINR